MEVVWIIRADAHAPGFFKGGPRVAKAVGNLKPEPDLLRGRGGEQGLSGAEIHF
jgi:hypothetical protein